MYLLARSVIEGKEITDIGYLVHQLVGLSGAVVFCANYFLLGTVFIA